jgi:hypothetical protein
MTYVDQVLSWMPEVFKPQKKSFIALLGALMCFTGRATMRNLSRYGAGSEKRLRRWASEDFDFLEFNTRLLSRHQVISQNPQRVCAGSPSQAILIDATFLRKSGAQTEGLAYFHNGSSRALNKLERGLEMSLIAIVNLEERSAYALSMHQSVDQSALQVAEGELCLRSEELQEFSRHVVADGYYARAGFISALIDEGFEIVTLLRRDAALRYLYQGDYNGRGRPKLYAGRVDYEDLGSFQRDDHLREDSQVYSKVVNYAAWDRNIKVVIKVDRRGNRRVLCSTDLSLSAEEILNLYESRFQIEFLFRDAKQHTGLGHSQVLDSKGQEHFANSSLTALNLLRLEDRAWALSEGICLRYRVGSIGPLKLRKYNQLLLNRFISALGDQLTREKVRQVYEQSYQTGVLAA